MKRKVPCPMASRTPGSGLEVIKVWAKAGLSNQTNNTRRTPVNKHFRGCMESVEVEGHLFFSMLLGCWQFFSKRVLSDVMTQYLLDIATLDIAVALPIATV